jgi:hypothetical protein
MFAPVRIKEPGTAKLERKGRRIQNHAAKRERVRDKDAEGRAADPQGASRDPARNGKDFFLYLRFAFSLNC